MKIRLLENHMTAVEIKLAHAILANSTEIGATAKSPRKAMELVAINKTSDVWTAEFRIEETAGEKGRYLNAKGEVELKNQWRTVKVEIYGEGVVAVPSQETAATETVETATSPVQTTAAPATPAVETATQTTAPAAELKMPFNPLQNNAMFHKQIREFLGTDCTVQNVDVEWYEDKKYRVVTTVGTVYEVVLRGDFYVFTKTAETMPPAAELKETTPAVQTTDVWQTYLDIVKTSLEEQARRTGGITGPTNNDVIDVYLDSIPDGDDIYCQVERTIMDDDSAMPSDVEWEVIAAFPSSLPKNVKWEMVSHICGRAAIDFDDEMAKECYADDDYVPEEVVEEEYWEFNEEYARPSMSVTTATPAVEINPGYKVGVLNNVHHKFTKANNTAFEHEYPSDNSYLEWIINHPGTPAVVT